MCINSKNFIQTKTNRFKILLTAHTSAGMITLTPVMNQISESVILPDYLQCLFQAEQSAHYVPNEHQTH